MNLCNFHEIRSNKDIKRNTGYCTKKDVNLLPSDCENCNERENYKFFNKVK